MLQELNAVLNIFRSTNLLLVKCNTPIVLYSSAYYMQLLFATILQELIFCQVSFAGQYIYVIQHNMPNLIPVARVPSIRRSKILMVLSEQPTANWYGRMGLIASDETARRQLMSTSCNSADDSKISLPEKEQAAILEMLLNSRRLH